MRTINPIEKLLYLPNPQSTDQSDTHPRTLLAAIRAFSLGGTDNPFRYTVAVALVLIVTAFKLSLPSIIGTSTPFFLLVFPVIISAWYGGYGPGFVALSGMTLISGSFLKTGAMNASIMRTGIFVVEGVAATLICGTSREAYAEMKSRRNYFEALIKNNYDVLCLLDPRGTVLFASPSVRKVLGYTVREFIGRSGFVSVHPEDRPRILRRMSELLHKPGESLREQTRIARKDGRYIWVEAIGTNLLKNKDVGAIVINFRDVTAEKNAFETNQLLSAVVTSSFDAIFTKTPEGVITTWNSGAERMYGYTPNEIIGKHVSVLATPDRKSEIATIMAKLRAGERINKYITTRKTKHGDVLHVSLTISPMWDSSGNFMGASTIARDITQEKLREEQIAASRRQLETILEGVADGITAQDSTGRLLYANSAAARLIGFEDVNTLLNTDPKQILNSYEIKNEAGEHLDINALPSRTALEGKNPQPMVVRFSAGGTERWAIAKASPILDQNGSTLMVVNIFRDITQRKNTEDLLRFQASHDMLTGLTNRQALVELLPEILVRARESKRMAAVLFIDLDRLTKINDAFGHEVGDQVLQKVAKRLRRIVRGEDMVARFGGDEFLIVMPSLTEPHEALQLANRIIRKMHAHFQVGDHDLHASASIGIALYPADGDDANTLLKNADVALYRAKEAGRNQYKLFSQTMALAVPERLALESHLRFAAARNELTLSYQPIIDLIDGSMPSVEALVRWKHPKFGMLFPGDFIPIAEDMGSIIQIDHWVLRNACKQSIAWDHHNLAPAITINLSARQFSQPNLVDHIAETIREFNIDPKRLQFEITETIAMEDIEQTCEKLGRLRDLGTQIIMDDFGTGYSSLNYLKRFPLHKLKIDQSFVRNCINEESDAAIIKAIIAMAHSLKLKVIAEGVETAEQLDFLCALGCDYVQGFLVSKPMNGTELKPWTEMLPEMPFQKKIAVNYFEAS